MGVAGHEQHLMVLGRLGERLRDRGGTPGIEVHQHVVEYEREGLGAFGKGLGEPEPEAQVQLLDAPAAQVARVDLGSGR